MKMEECDGLAAKWNFAPGTLHGRTEERSHRRADPQNGCGLLPAASAYLSLRRSPLPRADLFLRAKRGCTAA